MAKTSKKPQSAPEVEVSKAVVDELRSHGTELFAAHYQEIALNKGVMQLEIDWRRYYELEERGLLLALAAWELVQPLRPPRLVGYSVSFLMTHLHYAKLTYCQNDVLFVRDDCRANGVGLRLIRETERLAKDRGARLVMWHSKPGTALERVLPKLGYGVQDIMHSKEL